MTRATAAAQRLLERGANTDSAARNGLTPLHVAAIRDNASLTSVLLRFGADPRRRDLGDRTPADWARAKGHGAVLEALGASPVWTDPSADAGRPDTASDVGWATGIKAVDLFAALFVGARVECLGGHGVGRNVLLAELSERALRLPVGSDSGHGSDSGRDCASVLWASWTRHAWEVAALDQLQAETGLVGRVALLSAEPDDSDPKRRELAGLAIAQAKSRGESTGAPVLLVLFAESGYEADIEAALPGVAASTICVVTPPWQNAKCPSSATPSAPFDVRLAFDPLLAAARLFPAIDPFASQSRGVAYADRGAGSAGHVRVANQARALLGRYRKLDPKLDRPPVSDLCAGDRVWAARAQRLQAFLTQPFHTTESFVSAMGADLSIEATLSRVRSILEGDCDDIEVVHFYYKGGLDEIRAAAHG